MAILKNKMTLTIDAKSINQSFARSVIAAFAAELNPTVGEISDIKTAVSEAVANCIIHGYENEEGKIVINADIEGNTLRITVADTGKGIASVSEAIQPFYTTKPEDDRSGMGFTVMQTFMDEFNVVSEIGKGTTVTMSKTIGTERE